VLDYFDTLSLGWRLQRRSEVGLLTRGAVAVRRRGLTTDLARYRAGLAVLELAGLGAREGEADPGLYRLTEETLDVVAAGTTDPRLAVIAFDLRFLACMGLTPALVRCAACGEDAGGRRPPPRRATASVPFSAGAGGRLCPRCAGEARHGGRHVVELPAGLLRIAQSLLDTPTPNLARVRLDRGVTDEVGSFTRRFLEYHLETRPRSRRRRGERSRGPRPPAPPR
jgi:DNA repair protein RecO